MSTKRRAEEDIYEAQEKNQKLEEGESIQSERLEFGLQSTHTTEFSNLFTREEYQQIEITLDL